MDCVRSTGPITEHDRAELEKFREFVRDVGPLADARPEVILKWADYLGLDEDTRAELRRQAG